jgi:hypothetical protein
MHPPGSGDDPRDRAVLLTQGNEEGSKARHESETFTQTHHMLKRARTLRRIYAPETRRNQGNFDGLPSRNNVNETVGEDKMDRLDYFFIVM